MWEKGRDVDEVAGAGHRYTITGSVEWESTSYVTLPRISLIGCCPSDYEHVDELVDRRRLQALLIAAQLENRLAPLLRKAARKVGAEFRFEQGNAFVAAAAVADRIFYRQLARCGSVPEENLQLVPDPALPGIEIIARVALVLDADHLGAERIDARIGGDSVLVVGGAETAFDQADRHHVLDAVIAIRRIVQRAFLVDDADRRLVGDDLYSFYVVEAILDLRMQLDRRLHRGLRVELGREGDLEQHVLHHVGAVAPRKPERLAAKEDVVEAPDPGGEDRRIAHLSGLGDQGEAHGPRCR